MQDLSWMGLFKKGYKLQFKDIDNLWHDIREFNKYILINGFKIRYKHSIQS